MAQLASMRYWNLADPPSPLGTPPPPRPTPGGTGAGVVAVEERTALQPFADAPADPTARSHTQSIVCLAGLGFHFVLDFPINLVLAAADIGQYNAIFGFLPRRLPEPSPETKTPQAENFRGW